MKKYELWEAIKMIGENKGIRFTNGRNTIGVDDMSYLKIKESKYSKLSLDENLKVDCDEWILVQEQVSFEEVLNSDKKCRVEHDLLKTMTKECNSDEELIVLYVKRLYNGGSMYLGKLITALSWMSSEEDLKEIIKNGKWYLED